MVDHAELCSRLRQFIASKPAHGQRDLLVEMARLEAECSVPADQYHRVLSRFSDELEAAFLNVMGSASPTSEPAGDTGSAVAAADPPSIGANGRHGGEAWRPPSTKPSTSDTTTRRPALSR